MSRFGNLTKLILTVAFVFAVSSLQAFAQDDVSSGSSVVIINRSTAAPRGKSARKPAPPRRSTTDTAAKPNANRKNKTGNTALSEPKDSKDAVSGEDTFLNEQAALLPLPVWTQEAKAANADGLVDVVITIDEKGDVTEAKARAGNELLYESAEKAALQAKFNPSKTSKRTGFLRFCFGNHPDCN
jgi:outer membrane biosynthesis protein TonB